MNRLVAAVVTALLPLSVSSYAWADGAGSFGAQGQIAISSDLQLSIQRITVSPPQGDSESSTDIVVQPALDYFVIDNLSVGGVLSLTHSSPEEGDSFFTFGIGPRIGYNIPINDVLSFWPRAGIVYRRLSRGDASAYTINTGIYAPLMIHPVEHFFIGFGPNISTDLVSKMEGENSYKTTAFGLMTAIGGYF